MAGVAYVALLPFDILTDAVGRIAPLQVPVRGRRVVIYWPFWHEEDAGRIVPPVRSAAIPSRSATEPFFRIPPLEMRFQIRFPPNRAFANAIRVDVDGELDEDFATDVTNTLLRQLRVRTNQWWIGQSHREGEGLIRAAYKVDNAGTLASRDCLIGVRVEPRFRIERSLSPRDFSAACAGLAAAQEVPAFWELFLDAVYFCIHRSDLRRALLDSCIACELAVHFNASRALREAGRPLDLLAHSLSDRDLLHNLRAGLSELFGPQADYSVAHPDDYELIRRLWAVRGGIAHGQVGGHQPERREAVSLMEASTRLFEWLSQLPAGIPIIAA